MLPTTMPATAPAGKAELLLEAAWCRLGGGAACVSGVSGRSVTRLPFTPQPEKESSTMSCGLACWTCWVPGAGEGAGMAVEGASILKQFLNVGRLFHHTHKHTTFLLKWVCTTWPPARTCS